MEIVSKILIERDSVIQLMNNINISNAPHCPNSECRLSVRVNRICVEITKCYMVKITTLKCLFKFARFSFVRKHPRVELSVILFNFFFVIFIIFVLFKNRLARYCASVFPFITFCLGMESLAITQSCALRSNNMFVHRRINLPTFSHASISSTGAIQFLNYKFGVMAYSG